MQWVGVLRVSPFKIGAAAVHFKIPLTEVDLSKAIFSRESLLLLAILRLTESEGIEGWSLSRPEFHARECSEVNCLCFQTIAISKDKVRLQLLHFLTRWVEERYGNSLLRCSLIAIAYGKVYRCSRTTRCNGSRTRCNSSLNIMICQVSLWCSHKVDITMNTTHMPHILTLKIRAIAPTNHLYGNIILTSAEIFSNVKLADIVCSFRITHLIAIHINVSSRVDTIKMEEDTLILPACRQSEITTIRAH